MSNPNSKDGTNRLEKRLMNNREITRSDSDCTSDLHHSLRASRRRSVIRLLGQGDESELSTRVLARQITAIEKEIEVEEASGEAYRNVYNALSQSHLPALAEADIIKYDSQRQTVSTGPDFLLAYLIELTTTGVVEALTVLDSETDPSTGD